MDTLKTVNDAVTRMQISSSKGLSLNAQVDFRLTHGGQGAQQWVAT